MKLIKSVLFFVGTLAFLGCNPKIVTPEASKGEIDPSNYIALGGAITAGYTNGGLYYAAQQNSYANLIAEQLKLVGGSEFKIPYVAQTSIGIGSANNAPSVLGDRTDCLGFVSLGPVKIAPQGDLSVFASNVYSSQGAFNNFGVPDVKVIEMSIGGYSNPFYQRMASGASSSVLFDAVSKNSTFFTLMLGMNDVLNYALKGAASENITPSIGAIGTGFDASINDIIDKLTLSGAKGVIANIPSIKSMAFFKTITYDALKLDSSKSASLNQFYNLLDTTIKFKVGNNAFIIEDLSQPLLFRQAQANEFILLTVPLDSIKCNNMGSLIPIPSRHVLTISEINEIENAITDYNITLKSIALSKNLAFVDVHSFFEKVKIGFVYNGVAVNSSFVSGGFYSLDGLNLTPRGNALLANEFIKSINTRYKSTIPEINAIKYSGVIFP